MKVRILIFLALVVVSMTACSAERPIGVQPTPTRAFIPLPTRPAGTAAQSITTPVPVPTATQPSVRPSATPTRVLWAPLPTGVPAVLATLESKPPSPTPTSAASAASASTTAQPTPRPSVSGRIVMQTASGGDIVLLRPDGTKAATLTNGLDPAWSPDGTKIAFARWTEPQGIYVMNADSSDLHVVYKINGAKSPTWSPDGTKIAFTWLYKTVAPRPPRGTPSAAPVGRDYWRTSVIDLITGNKTDIPLDDDGHAFAPHWGPDGRFVYKAVRGLGVTEETGTPRLITDNPLHMSPVWSPDGTKIAFMVHQHDHWDIAVANSDGSGLTYLTSTPFVMFTKPINNAAPAWSPDGRSIIFLSDRDGDWHVYIMNADGSGQRMLSAISVVYDFAGERVFSWAK